MQASLWRPLTLGHSPHCSDGLRGAASAPCRGWTPRILHPLPRRPGRPRLLPGASPRQSSRPGPAPDGRRSSRATVGGGRRNCEVRRTRLPPAPVPEPRRRFCSFQSKVSPCPFDEAWKDLEVKLNITMWKAARALPRAPSSAGRSLRGVTSSGGEQCGARSSPRRHRGTWKRGVGGGGGGGARRQRESRTRRALPAFIRSAHVGGLRSSGRVLGRAVLTRSESEVRIPPGRWQPVGRGPSAPRMHSFLHSFTHSLGSAHRTMS